MRHQRPKLERYDKTLFLVLKTVNYVEHESVAKAREIVETGEIMVFVGADFVVTVRHGEHGELASVRKHVDASPALAKLGPYAVMHAIADHVVDHYLDVTDHRSRPTSTRWKRNIFSPRTHTNIECIYLLKREVVELRRAVGPLTVALQRLGTDHNDLISIEVRRYMRDVLDHQIQASDRINSYDDMLSSLVQAALGKVAMQQNVDMRKISAWVAIAAVPTAIAGYLRNELRPHARAQGCVGVSRRARFDARHMRVPVLHLPPGPLALARLRSLPARVEHIDPVLFPRLPHRARAFEPHPCRLVGGDGDRLEKLHPRCRFNPAVTQQKCGERCRLPRRLPEVDKRVGGGHQPLHDGCRGEHRHAAGKP